jgi:hypothetical protein
MKQLLLNVMLFVTFNAVWMLACELLMPEPASSLRYKRQIADTHFDADTLILGSSHATDGVAPRFLHGAAVNLANISQDLYYDCEIARLYVPHMPRLRRLVLEASYLTWEYSLSRSTEHWRVEIYYHVFGIPPQHWSWRLGYYSRIASYGAARAACLRREPNIFDPDGWHQQNGTLDPRTGKSAADRHLSFMSQEETATNIERTAILVRDCRSRGVEVVLVTFPVHECYRKELNQEALQRMRKTTYRFCGENRVRHLDYFEDGRFTADDFADGDHLNVNGAEKFTRILESDLGGAVSLRADARHERNPIRQRVYPTRGTQIGSP